jgi:hypothetical protein
MLQGTGSEGSAMARRVKVALDMDAVVWEQIEDFAAGLGWDSAQFVRHALGTERFLIEQESYGVEIFLRFRDQDGQDILPLRIGPGPTPRPGTESE